MKKKDLRELKRKIVLLAHKKLRVSVRDLSEAMSGNMAKTTIHRITKQK